MKRNYPFFAGLIWSAFAVLGPAAFAQVGNRLPSEKKKVIDPVTGTELTFLTSTQAGDSKIYQTHPDWTADGQWLIFRSNRVRGQAFAVNEASGDIVQLTDQGYLGMLCLARLSMKLYIMRDAGHLAPADTGAPTGPPEGAARPKKGRGGFNRPTGPFQIVEIDLARLFADSKAGTASGSSAYERVCGTMPTGMRANGNMGLDAREDFVYFSISGPELAKDLPAGTGLADPFGPRNMGAGPTGLASMNLKTGEVKIITVVPFQIGHVQTNPWMPGEIVFCWETGGKAPQRTWTVRSDGSGLRPLYPEAPFEWITHEAVITRDEVAIAIIAHRKVGPFPDFAWKGGQLEIAPSMPAATGVTPPPATLAPNAEGIPSVATAASWGPSGTDDHPSGVAIVNLRTREMRIIGQVPVGNIGRSIWHVNGSADGRWAAADDFQYRLWLIDRHTGEMIMLADLGHKTTAADHIHPTFSADGTKIEVQSAMLSADNRSLNICVIPVPKTWLARTYSLTAPK